MGKRAITVRIDTEVLRRIKPATEVFGVSKWIQNLMDFCTECEVETNAVAGPLATAVALGDFDKARKIIGGAK